MVLSSLVRKQDDLVDGLCALVEDETERLRLTLASLRTNIVRLLDEVIIDER